MRIMYRIGNIVCCRPGEVIAMKNSARSEMSRLVRLSLLAGAVCLARRFIRLQRKLDLGGRTVLITGGSRGLGLALAREFARRGSQVALCARDADELAAAAADIERLHGRVKIFVCDLRDESQISSLVQNVKNTCGEIDVLVNNAGTISVGPLETMTIEDFREAMDVNFWSAVHTTKAVAPGMIGRGCGRIVNIASIGGKIPVPHLAPYCASKFALVGFSSALRIELAKDGVLVTTVNPGLMRTGSPRNASFKGKYRAEYAWFSISDVMPGLSISAAGAARRIVRATVFGEAEVIIGLPAKVAARLYGVAPGLSVELTALADRLFPRAGRSSQQPRRGYESESWVTQAVLSKLGRKAERQYNQI